jgi:hypothetical protein
MYRTYTKCFLYCELGSRNNFQASFELYNVNKTKEKETKKARGKLERIKERR